ncbi:hypothetical protein I3I95_08365 [bacterium]|nr:hypothetical protein [bacterium]
MDNRTNERDAQQPQPTDAEQFLAKMLHQSEEVSGETFRIIGNRVCTEAEAEEIEREEQAPAERPLTPEEDQLVRERQAVLAVIDDIRRESSRGHLVDLARWEQQGFAPAHMTPDEFTSFAMDSITAAQEGKPFDGSGMPVPAPDGEVAQDEADVDEVVATSDGEVAHLADGEPDAGAEEAAAEGAASGEGASDAPDALRAARKETSPDQTGETDQLGQTDQAGQTCETGQTDETTPAAGDADGGVAGTGAETQQAQQLAEPSVLQGVHDNLDCKDVCMLDGSTTTYLYSDRYMSDNYATWSLEAREGDDVMTLVRNARDESRLYPRPMLARSLCNKPFGMSYDHVTETFKAVQASGDYPDIQQCEASNGDVYYFSTTYMSRRQARSLAEYYSVERFMSV